MFFLPWFSIVNLNCLQLYFMCIYIDHNKKALFIIVKVIVILFYPKYLNFDTLSINRTT